MPLIASILLSVTCFVVTTLLDKRANFFKHNSAIKSVSLGLITGLFCIFATYFTNQIHTEGFVLFSSAIIILTVLYYGFLAGATSALVSVAYLVIHCLISMQYPGIVASIIGVIVSFAVVCPYKKFFVKNDKDFLNVAIVVLLLSICSYIVVILLSSNVYNIIDVIYVIKINTFNVFVMNIVSVVLAYFAANMLLIKLDKNTILSYYKQRVDAITGQVTPAFRAVVFTALFAVMASVYFVSCISNVNSELIHQQDSVDNGFQVLSEVNSKIEQITSDDIAIYNSQILDLVTKQIVQGSSAVDTNYHFVVCDDNFNVLGIDNPNRIKIPEDSLIKNNIVIADVVFTSQQNNTETSKDVSCLITYRLFENYKIVAFAPEKEVMFFSYYSNLMTLIYLIVAYAVLTLIISLVFKKLVESNLMSISNSLENILEGNYVSLNSPKSLSEFANIEASIDKTVKQFKEKIRKETERYAADFELAKQIQLNSLPHVFPPFPQYSEIDIYAKYKAAFQVGGDFYDYYFIDKNLLALLIADVSGKGISAAMFMMKAKMAFMAYSETLKRPHAVMSAVNNYLCRDNDATIFVTCFFGVINIDNGKLDYVCAGHDCPMLLRKHSHIRTLKAHKGVMLGFKPDYIYQSSSVQMLPGDSLFLYTDGVTEAKNENNNLFGKQNLKRSLAETYESYSLKELCNHVDNKITKFCGVSQQFDDITMLAFKFHGQVFLTDYDDVNRKYTAKMSCSLQNVSKTINYFTKICKLNNVREASLFLLHTIIDELLSNVIRYSNIDNRKRIMASLEFENSNSWKKLIRIKIIDEGKQFNPFASNKDNNLLNLKSLNPGGVGLQIVKQKANSFEYKYYDGKNINIITIKY